MLCFEIEIGKFFSLVAGCNECEEGNCAMFRNVALSQLLSFKKSYFVAFIVAAVVCYTLYISKICLTRRLQFIVNSVS